MPKYRRQQRCPRRVYPHHHCQACTMCGARQVIRPKRRQAWTRIHAQVSAGGADAVAARAKAREPANEVGTAAGAVPARTRVKRMQAQQQIHCICCAYCHMGRAACSTNGVKTLFKNVSLVQACTQHPGLHIGGEQHPLVTLFVRRPRTITCIGTPQATSTLSRHGNPRTRIS